MDAETGSQQERSAAPSAPFVRLILLTGQRRGEIAGLLETFYSHNQQTITLPGTLTKNHLEHTFPVGSGRPRPAQKLLRRGETVGLKLVTGAVAGLVGIECGVVSGVINLESSGVEASDWRPRHDEHYYEA